MKITLVAGARPNFMKIAPIIHAIDAANKAGGKLSYRLVHTGQHYVDKLSEIFFKELNIPKANVKSGGWVWLAGHSKQQRSWSNLKKT